MLLMGVFGQFFTGQNSGNPLFLFDWHQLFHPETDGLFERRSWKHFILYLWLLSGEQKRKAGQGRTIFVACPHGILLGCQVSGCGNCGIHPVSGGKSGSFKRMGGFLPSGGVVCGDSAGISAFSVLVLGCSGGEKHGGNFFNGFRFFDFSSLDP